MAWLLEYMNVIHCDCLKPLFVALRQPTCSAFELLCNLAVMYGKDPRTHRQADQRCEEGVAKTKGNLRGNSECVLDCIAPCLLQLRIKETYALALQVACVHQECCALPSRSPCCDLLSC